MSHVPAPGEQIAPDFGPRRASPIQTWRMDAISEAPLQPPPSGSLRGSRVSDELLARQAARGSDRALAAIYHRYHQPLYQYCRSILRADPDAQDALQSTFAKAIAALREGRRTAPLRPWLYRIAHNESISLIRLRRHDSLEETVDHPHHAAASAEEEADSRERWNVLVADLAELPERQRGALLLRELGGLSHQEIAVALGMSLSSAKQ